MFVLISWLTLLLSKFPLLYHERYRPNTYYVILKYNTYYIILNKLMKRNEKYFDYRRGCEIKHVKQYRTKGMYLKLGVKSGKEGH